MTVADLDDPAFDIPHLSEEDFVIYRVASKVLQMGDRDFAGRIVRREEDRDPMVHFALFFSRSWLCPEASTELWDEVLAEMKLHH